MAFFIVWGTFQVIKLISENCLKVYKREDDDVVMKESKDTNEV